MRESEERAFLIRLMNPATAPRLAPCVAAMRALLTTSPGTEWVLVVDAGQAAGDCARGTIRNVLNSLIKEGMVLQRGERQVRSRRGIRSVIDTRKLRMGAWPDPVPQPAAPTPSPVVKVPKAAKTAKPKRSTGLLVLRTHIDPNDFWARGSSLYRTETAPEFDAEGRSAPGR